MVKRFQFTAVLSFGKEGSVGMFRCPWGVAVNATDCHNHRIQIFDRNGDYLRSFCRESRKAGEFNYPRGIASHNNGNIFVANPDNHRVQIFTGEGQNVDSFGGKGNLDNQLNFP